MLLALASLLVAAYNPMDIKGSEFTTSLLSVHDAERKRDIPIKLYLPKSGTKLPVILYSHGLGGSRETAPFMGEHWAKRGYVCVFMQHPGSDDSVWKGTAVRDRMKAMNTAANAENFRLRAEDVRAVIDQLEKLSAQSGQVLAGRMDLNRLGMSGHSFGAVTTQAVSGQAFGPAGARLTDKRIKAAMPFSPSAPKVGSAKVAFGSVSIPWMCMTGTEDTSPIGNTSVEDRLNVYPNLSSKVDRFEVVLWEAEHSVFAGVSLPGDRRTARARQHETILALSTAFWDTELKADSQARTWLFGDGAKKEVEPKDSWKASPGKSR